MAVVQNSQEELSLVYCRPRNPEYTIYCIRSCPKASREVDFPENPIFNRYYVDLFDVV
jgi:hypothetical protein